MKFQLGNYLCPRRKCHRSGDNMPPQSSVPTTSRPLLAGGVSSVGLGYFVLPLSRTGLTNEVGAFPTGRAFRIVHPAWLGFLWLHVSPVCSLCLLLCCPTYSHDSEQELESKENAESGLSGASGHWVDCFLGLVRD